VEGGEWNVDNDFDVPYFFTPAAESHGLWPWMNAPALGRDVAPLGRSLGATGFDRGAPLSTCHAP